MQADYDKLWTKIDRKSDSECWLWTGVTNDRGYGYLRIGPKQKYAHRLVWEITRGQKLQEGNWVRHTCENNACCNPRHMQVKMYRGAGHPRSKLTEGNVIDIRNLYTTTGQSHSQLGSQFNVSKRTIGRIVTGNGWKHVNLV